MAALAHTLPAGERRVCPAARPGVLECQSVFELARSRRDAPAFVSSTATAGGYGPAALRAAYGLTRASLARGRHETIAVVDAYQNPDAARNLASYRRYFGIRPCTTSSGCLRIVNQYGRSAPLPKANMNWAVEESLDLDMISAICPRCHILLVEARSPTRASLGVAENTAVAMGARFVSNSWSGTEMAGQWAFNHYFNHPGDALVFASGDNGYGTAYPADLQYVTAVGGTTLRRRASRPGRGWTETAWGSAGPGAAGTGSGCALLATKPSWQREPVDTAPGGCANRTENDVAAVANPATGVAVYDTFRTGGRWAMLGGTSAATPIVAAVYALAGNPAPRSYPASYLYQHPGRFHDVTSGTDGACPSLSGYLCQAVIGYDGPTGLGTPRGTYGFSSRGTDPVTLLDPGSRNVIAGQPVALTIRGLDTRAAARSLAFTATGLPAGLSVSRVPGSTNGAVTGTLSSAIASGTIFSVVVTATDGKTGRSATTRFTIRVR